MAVTETRVESSITRRPPGVITLRTDRKRVAILSTRTSETVNCVVSLETAACATRTLFSHLSDPEKLMKPGATAARATKWLLINSPLSRGTITTQPDIRNEGCFVPAASGDQQTAPRTARLMLKTSFQGIFQPFPGLRKSDMKTEEGRKRKNNKETLSRTDGNAVARRRRGAAHARQDRLKLAS